MCRTTVTVTVLAAPLWFLPEDWHNPRHVNSFFGLIALAVFTVGFVSLLVYLNKREKVDYLNADDSEWKLALACSVVGSAWFVLGWNGLHLWTMYRVKGHQTVEGVVERQVLYDWQVFINDGADEVTEYAPEAQYLYEVDGTLYRGYRWELIETKTSLSRGRVVSDLAGNMFLGKTVRVHYDPDGLVGSYLEQGKPRSRTYYLVCLGLFYAFLGYRLSRGAGISWMTYLLAVPFIFAAGVWYNWEARLQPDTIVTLALDPRPTLERIAAVSPAEKSNWKDLKLGVTLEQTLGKLESPNSLQLTTPDSFTLHYFSGSRLTFQRENSEAPFLLARKE